LKKGTFEKIEFGRNSYFNWARFLLHKMIRCSGIIFLCCLYLCCQSPAAKYISPTIRGRWKLKYLTNEIHEASARLVVKSFSFLRINNGLFLPKSREKKVKKKSKSTNLPVKKILSSETIIPDSKKLKLIKRQDFFMKFIQVLYTVGTLYGGRIMKKLDGNNRDHVLGIRSAFVIYLLFCNFYYFFLKFLISLKYKHLTHIPLLSSVTAPGSDSENNGGVGSLLEDLLREQKVSSSATSLLKTLAKLNNKQKSSNFPSEFTIKDYDHQYNYSQYQTLLKDIAWIVFVHLFLKNSQLSFYYWTIVNGLKNRIILSPLFYLYIMRFHALGSQLTRPFKSSLEIMMENFSSFFDVKAEITSNSDSTEENFSSDTGKIDEKRRLDESASSKLPEEGNEEAVAGTTSGKEDIEKTEKIERERKKKTKKELRGKHGKTSSTSGNAGLSSTFVTSSKFASVPVTQKEGTFSLTNDSKDPNLEKLLQAEREYKKSVEKLFRTDIARLDENNLEEIASEQTEDEEILEELPASTKFEKDHPNEAQTDLSQEALNSLNNALQEKKEEKNQKKEKSKEQELEEQAADEDLDSLLNSLDNEFKPTA
jgi:hypothetical protein